jgi:YesN/AraC family two-component response regulator
MNNYLAKPVKQSTLKALLESYLSKGDGDAVSERQKSDDADARKKRNESNRDTANGEPTEREVGKPAEIANEA